LAEKLMQELIIAGPLFKPAFRRAAIAQPGSRGIPPRGRTVPDLKRPGGTGASEEPVGPALAAAAAAP